MSKYTNEDMQKAAACCQNCDCGNCPLVIGEGVCDFVRVQLGFLRRQKARIEELKTENRILSQKRMTIFEKCEAFERGYTRAIEEFWNSRPEYLNEQCEGREEYNKGWNACLDEFFEIRNNLVKETVGEEK